jgi:hypothetical protein
VLTYFLVAQPLTARPVITRPVTAAIFRDRIIIRRSRKLFSGRAEERQTAKPPAYMGEKWAGFGPLGAKLSHKIQRLLLPRASAEDAIWFPDFFT